MAYKAVHSGGSQPTLQRIIGCTCCLLHVCLLLDLTLDPYDRDVCFFETSQYQLNLKLSKKYFTKFVERRNWKII